jgi:hypothetical protein
MGNAQDGRAEPLPGLNAHIAQLNVIAVAGNQLVAEAGVDALGLIPTDPELQDLAQEGQTHVAALGIKPRTTYDVNRIVDKAIADLRDTYNGRREQ